MAKKGTFSGTYVEFVGYEELLRKIDKVSGSVNKPLETAIKEGSKIAERDMLAFIRKHRLTGGTESSFEEGKVVWSGDTKVNFSMGFNIKKGGLPALFLDVGTPKIKPSFFVYYAINNHYQEIYDTQKQALQKALFDVLGGYD